MKAPKIALNHAQFFPALRRAGLMTALFVALVYTLFLSSAVSGWLNPVLFAIAALCFGLVRRTPSGLELPVAAFLVVLWVAAAAGLDPRRSFEQLRGLTQGFMLIFFTAALVRWLSPGRLVGLLLAAGGLYMAWAWSDAAGWYLRWLQAAPGQWLPELPFRLNGSNNVAAYLNLLLFMALGALFTVRRTVQRVLLFGYLLSAGVLLFLSNSRGGWIGTAGGAAACLALFAFQRGSGLGQWLVRLLRSRRFWFLAAAGLLLAGGLVWFYLARLANHPTHGSRFDFWLVGLQAFLRSPLLGSGPNTYVIFHMQANSYPPTEAFLHSHNQYIDILAASGLFGAAAFVTVLVALARRGLQTWQNPGPAGRGLWIGGVAALAAFFAHGVFDGLYRMPWAALTCAVLLGTFTAHSSERLAPTGPVRWGRLAVWLPPLLAIGCAAAGLWNAWRTEPYLAGVQVAAAGDLPAATDLFVEASRRDPNFAPIFTQLGLVQAQRAAAGETALLVASAATFEQAALLDPAWGLNHAQLCAVQSALGHLAQAESACRQAVAAAPAAALFWYNLAVVQEKSGSDPSAAYQQVLMLAPETRTASFWQSTPVRRAASLAALAAAPVAVVPSTIPALESLAAAGNARVAEYLALSQAYRLAGRQTEAAAAFLKAGLAYATPADTPERLWQQAELGVADQAAGLHKQAADLLLHPGLYGPQLGGQNSYLSQAFFVPALSTDLVPQLLPLPLSAEWQLRLEENGEP